MTELELEIERVAHGGIFVARHQGRVVFVTGALPGERVRARLVDDSNARFWRAETTAVLQASAHRRQSVWPLGANAGAEFGHITLEHQRELKTEVLQEALTRFGGFEPNSIAASVEPLPGETDGLGYRTRVQLQLSPKGVPGVFRERSHDHLPATELPLAVAEINESGLLSGRYQGAKKLSIAIDSDSNLQWWVDNQKHGIDRLRQVAGNREFRLSGGFWQVHRAAAETLWQTVSHFANELGLSGDVLDLYSGAGLFAANLAPQLTSVTAVEASAQSVADGRKSAKDLSNLDFVKSDVLQFLRANDRQFDAVLLDPPRSGANQAVLAAISEIGASQIIYVACDPVALARDLKQLTDAGWRLHAMRAFDLFPHTHHFEIVVALTR